MSAPGLNFQTLTILVLSIVTIINAEFTKEEHVALDKFRPLVLDVLPNEYQRVDGYLIRWLRAKDLDVVSAKKMLMEAQKWRAHHKIDKILEETTIFDGMDFPDSTDDFDKEGFPVMTVTIGKLDIRRLILEGKKDKLFRAYVKLGETMERRAYEASNRTGTNNPHYIALSDYLGFNARQHLCVQCILFAQEFVGVTENYFPGSLKLNIFVNVPRIYGVLFKRIQSLQSAHTKRTLKIFGHNRAEWSDFIDKHIARDQRTYQFGGTKADEV